MAAMLTVLNRRWVSQGWRAMDPKDSKTMAEVWINELDRHSIPWQFYNDLYERAVDARIRAQADGRKVPDFNAELLAVCWPLLRQEVHQREVQAGRTLTGYAESLCPKCFGTGIPYKFDTATGKPLGAMAGKICDHLPEAGAPLFDPEKETEATFEQFLEVNAHVKTELEKQAREREPIASIALISVLIDDLFREVDALPYGSDEQRDLGGYWLILLGARHYLYDVDGK